MNPYLAITASWFDCNALIWIQLRIVTVTVAVHWLGPLGKDATCLDAVWHLDAKEFDFNLQNLKSRQLQICWWWWDSVLVDGDGLGLGAKVVGVQGDKSVQFAGLESIVRSVAISIVLEVVVAIWVACDLSGKSIDSGLKADGD